MVWFKEVRPLRKCEKCSVWNMHMNFKEALHGVCVCLPSRFPFKDWQIDFQAKELKLPQYSYAGWQDFADRNGVYLKLGFLFIPSAADRSEGIS